MAESGAIILDTPEQIDMARVITLAHGIALEINTGMQMSSRYSSVAVARGMGFPGRQKKGALKWLIKTYDLNVSNGMKTALGIS